MCSQKSSITASIKIMVLMALALSISIHADDSPFRSPEIAVNPSPGTTSRLQLAKGTEVIDFDVWPSGAEAVIAVRDGAGHQSIIGWRAGADRTDVIADLPDGFVPRAVACHPTERRVFVSGRAGGQSQILAIELQGRRWTTRSIYKSPRDLRRLLVGPRPFVTGYDAVTKTERLSYRLFFAVHNADGTYATRSITEDGRRDYQVIGPKSSVTTVPSPELPNADAPPSEASAASAVPASFHPAGHILIWQDAGGCYHQLAYDGKAWGATSAIAGPACGGSLTVTPNGASLLQWKRGVAGIAVYGDRGRSHTQQAADSMFTSTPSSVPDGKGIIGLTQQDGAAVIAYVPITVPLADVVNAWMFSENAADQPLLQKSQGLFRRLDQDQLYQLYDSEAYKCGGYDSTTPTRPYLVTTDIFWELFAAAYEGTMIVQERRRGLPAFWAFVEAAADALKARKDAAPWPDAFKALTALRDGTPAANAEAARIAQASGRVDSPIFGKVFDYGELKPRGHYASSPEMSLYFKAVHYLTQLAAERDPAVLATLPASVKAKAMQWIATYQDSIAPSRAPLVWASGTFAPPAYTRHPTAGAGVFPLSWGFDNEVLLSTVFHSDWPESEQITGPSGPRMMPSGLDLAAALGSRFARSLLAKEIGQYPPLGRALDALSARAPAPRHTANLYDRWIAALAVQWADDAGFPGVAPPAEMWKAKRLQTGLASWATLRHATVLVNERTAAECGEGGFEEIVLRPPRGYVEPDPKTFAAIAELFDRLAQSVSSSEAFAGATMKTEDAANAEALQQGILRRLKEAAAKARLFQAIAEKELRGEARTDVEYEEILYVGRVAEHHFLVFKSLANKDLALSNPDPMARIADVSGAAGGPFLEAGVGRPLEWDQIVTYFGRREVVKGSVYSYYEFTSPVLLNDADWRKLAGRQRRPAWIEPYVSSQELSCPAKAPF
ncbi:MAG TPA: DUF3160 domain-containing protein [Thermoanaerobaculia bacterium]|nr:DUF3160 domain-containing protein [Thermoanaerobaculia bacterium]